MCAAIPFIVLATFSALMGTSSTPAALAREATQDSYCLQGRQWGYPGNCQFSSDQQFMATASGMPIAGSTRCEPTRTTSWPGSKPLLER